MKSIKRTPEKINFETEERISKAVKRFEDGKINQEEFERIVGAITLVGMQNKQQLLKLSDKVSKIDFSDFLDGAMVI